MYLRTYLYLLYLSYYVYIYILRIYRYILHFVINTLGVDVCHSPPRIILVAWNGSVKCADFTKFRSAEPIGFDKPAYKISKSDFIAHRNPI